MLKPSKDSNVIVFAGLAYIKEDSNSNNSNIFFIILSLLKYSKQYNYLSAVTGSVPIPTFPFSETEIATSCADTKFPNTTTLK